jgi:hypothetical protein
MASDQIADSILAAAALASVILSLGAVFLLILRTPKFQFSLRFLLITIGCIAMSLGLWTALLRGIRGPSLTGPGVPLDAIETVPVVPPQGVRHRLPGTNEWSEPMDGPYEPKPIDRPQSTPDDGTRPVP